MQTYIGLANWTDHGIQEIKNSPQRLDSAKAVAKQFDGDILHFYMTMGKCDMVVISEFPDDAAAAKFVLHLSKGRRGADENAEGLYRGRIPRNHERAGIGGRLKAGPLRKQDRPAPKTGF